MQQEHAAALDSLHRQLDDQQQAYAMQKQERQEVHETQQRLAMVAKDEKHKTVLATALSAQKNLMRAELAATLATKLATKAVEHTTLFQNVERDHASVVASWKRRAEQMQEKAKGWKMKAEESSTAAAATRRRRRMVQCWSSCSSLKRTTRLSSGLQTAAVVGNLSF